MSNEITVKSSKLSIHQAEATPANWCYCMNVILCHRLKLPYAFDVLELTDTRIVVTYQSGLSTHLEVDNGGLNELLVPLCGTVEFRGKNRGEGRLGNRSVSWYRRGSLLRCDNWQKDLDEHMRSRISQSMTTNCKTFQPLSPSSSAYKTHYPLLLLES